MTFSVAISATCLDRGVETNIPKPAHDIQSQSQRIENKEDSQNVKQLSITVKGGKHSNPKKDLFELNPKLTFNFALLIDIFSLNRYYFGTNPNPQDRGPENS